MTYIIKENFHFKSAEEADHNRLPSKAYLKVEINKDTDFDKLVGEIFNNQQMKIDLDKYIDLLKELSKDDDIHDCIIEDLIGISGYDTN